MTNARLFTPQQIQALRYWIQGYQDFHEPPVADRFRLDLLGLSSADVR